MPKRSRPASLKSQAWQARQLSFSAHHEAGHAVLAFLLGIPFFYVTVRPESGNLGRIVLRGVPVWCEPHLNEQPRVKSRLEKTIIVLFAGDLVEEAIGVPIRDRGAWGD